jgi:hypothetical protein
MQFDLEKSYADGEQIISDVENIVKDTWRNLREDHSLYKFGEALVPVQKKHVASRDIQVSSTVAVLRRALANPSRTFNPANSLHSPRRLSPV